MLESHKANLLLYLHMAKIEMDLCYDLDQNFMPNAGSMLGYIYDMINDLRKGVENEQSNP